MNCLRSISLLLCFCAACAPSRQAVPETAAGIPFWTSEWMDPVQRNNFRITFSTPRGDLTGILMVKQVAGSWRGSIVNEFGLKVLDFVSSPQVCRLTNVLPFLDKRRIRQTLAADIQFIVEIDNPAYAAGVRAERHRTGEAVTVTDKKARRLHRFAGGEIHYKNLKYRLTYALKKLDDTER